MNTKLHNNDPIKTLLIMISDPTTPTGVFNDFQEEYCVRISNHIIKSLLQVENPRYLLDWEYDEYEVRGTDYLIVPESTYPRSIDDAMNDYYYIHDLMKGNQSEEEREHFGLCERCGMNPCHQGCDVLVGPGDQDDLPPGMFMG